MSNPLLSLKEIILTVGPGFHPDTPFDDYVMADHSPSFSEQEIALLDRSLQAEIATYDDIYAASVGIFIGLGWGV